MSLVHLITHPEVAIDPAIPVPDWGLSERGRVRALAMPRQSWARRLRLVASSAERKARETAAILAAPLGLEVVVDAGLGENDRSATGFLPGPEFEATADLFFAHPKVSIRGWERAVDAQARMVAAVGRVLGLAGTPGDIAIVAHGAVGALLLCHLTGQPISRAADQPGEGGGNIFTFGRQDRALRQGWRRIEAAS